jgi:hypothetical protein
MQRRRFIEMAALLAAMPAARARAAAPAAAATGLETSQLVYLTPLKADGSESTCHSEIWFQAYEGDVYVVTATEAWRARAIRAGLTKARIWVGDFGPWKESKDAFRQAPTFLATGSVVSDAAVHDAVLKRMGEKYASGWLTWGPRFRNGIESGTRVMLKYAAAV